jgi:hypothetical protein
MASGNLTYPTRQQGHRVWPKLKECSANDPGRHSAKSQKFRR